MADDVQFIIKNFRKKFGYDINLSNPQTISEKLQWIKLYGKLERFAKYTDKYEVRQFIKERIGEQYLVPLLGVYDNAHNIKVHSLPRSFALKATHGSCWNILVKDKSRLNWYKTRRRMNKWLNTNYCDLSGERNYKPLQGRAMIEKYLHDPSGDLKDYKIQCFHGKPMVVSVIGGRSANSKPKVRLYDMNWKEPPFDFTGVNLFPQPLKKPKRFSEMVAIAQQLSQDFPYVRVDLYHTNDKVYFGELTFVPLSGYFLSPLDFQKWLGSFLDLSRYV
ncbi:ATP-grasp fold amidoligase family protein [Brevibacillus sp. H7]|uniref:ATP-grasp fold amidoligase family protein n=1 Tax=Brevibacillus sp. H7 TaxID=3349138 RepID=UPI00382029A8